jgi:hypothetical protein
MREAGLPVWYTQGQHERSTPPWLSLHPWPLHAHQQLFSIGGRSCCGLDWLPAQLLTPAIQTLPPCDILICHQVWGEHMGSVCHPEGNLADIPHMRLVLTGDYHVHQATQHIGRTGQTLTALSPGAISLRNLGESAETAFFVVQDDLSYISVPLRTRPYRQVRLQTAADLDAFCASYAATQPAWPPDVELDGKPLLRVQYNADLPEAYSRVLSVVRSTAHLFLEPQMQQTETAIDLASESPTAFDGLLSAVAALTREQPADVRDGAQRLLQSSTPAEELAAMYEEHMRS